MRANFLFFTFIAFNIVGGRIPRNHVYFTWGILLDYEFALDTPGSQAINYLDQRD